MATVTHGWASTDDDVLYEVVDGLRVELPPMGTQAEGIANRLAKLMWLCLGDDPPGEIVVEMLFQLSPKLKRRPDVAYVPFERWPPDRPIPDTDGWEVIPAMATEVVSKTNTAIEIQGKIEEYFLHGVLLVWVIYPKQRRIHVYESPKTIRVLDANDVLEGGPVLPELRLPLKKLFEALPKVEQQNGY